MDDPRHGRVILRFRDGRILRGDLTSEFSPRDREIGVRPVDGADQAVDVLELKAVVFPKEPRQREIEIQMGAPATVRPGTAVARVEFFDGEIMRGRVHHYSVADHGFFLYPTSVESANERVFVVASALNTVAIEG